MANGKKLTLIGDIVNVLESEGVHLSPSAVRTRLNKVMLTLVKESCNALGVDVPGDEIDHIARSRSFQEAVASMLQENENHP